MTRHNNKKETYSDKWGTPPEWLAWVERTIGKDYLDPCPADWDGKVSGLDIPWDRNAYINHPGGRGNLKAWLWKLEMSVRPFFDYIWCGFNTTQLALSARHMGSRFFSKGYLVFPMKRIKYIWLGPDTMYRKHGEPVNSPNCDSFFWTTCLPDPNPPVPCMVIGNWCKVSYRIGN